MAESLADILQWVDKISKSVQEEATNGLHPKIPNADLVSEIVHVSIIFLAFFYPAVD